MTSAWILMATLLGCTTPSSQDEGPGSDTLYFTDENVAMIQGGYMDSPVAVKAGVDLCFDASSFSSSVGSIEVWHTGISDAALRCSLARGQLSQAVAVNGLWVQDPADGQACLSMMEGYADGPFLTCEEGRGWVVMARDESGEYLAFRILDPCGGDGETTVTLDETQPTFSDIEVGIEDAVAFTTQEGWHYTLDWSTLAHDGFGTPLDPPLYRIVIAKIPDAVPLEGATFDPELNADEYYEVMSGSSDATSADLMGDGDEDFPGFSLGGNWLIGFSPPSDCIPASIIGRVDVLE